MFSTQSQTDHADKQCIVKEVVQEGIRSNCGDWKPSASEHLLMPEETRMHLKAGDTFYFVWRETQWVAEVRDSAPAPRSSAQAITVDETTYRLPTANTSKAYAPCVVIAIDDSQARARCRVAILNDLVYANDETKADKNGIAVLSFPLQPAWRWPLAKEPGTRFYFEQVKEIYTSPDSVVICRVVYLPDQAELRSFKQLASPSCD